METPGRHDDVLTDYWRSVVDYVNGAPPPPPPQPKRYGAPGDSALSVHAHGKKKMMSVGAEDAQTDSERVVTAVVGNVLRAARSESGSGRSSLHAGNGHLRRLIARRVRIIAPQCTPAPLPGRVGRRRRLVRRVPGSSCRRGGPHRPGAQLVDALGALRAPARALRGGRATAGRSGAARHAAHARRGGGREDRQKLAEKVVEAAHRPAAPPRRAHLAGDVVSVRH